jgi:hypothetical protein
MATNDKEKTTPASAPSETKQEIGADKDVKGAMSDAEAGNKQVAENMAPEQEQGFIGVKVDPTPNEHYTVEGVTDAYAEANPPAGGPQAKANEA